MKGCIECEHGTVADIFTWKAAITDWHETGKTQTIEEGLKNGRPIPPFAREFIADILAKKVKRQPHRNSISLSRRNDFIRGNYRQLLATFQRLKKQSKLKYGEIPKDMAIKELAEIYDLGVDSIERIVKTRAKKGAYPL